MLDVNKMIASAHECIGWPYKSPGSNDKNGIDCSGMFVKMYREQGYSIAHGSNSIFREYCSETGKITSEKDLQLGMAVFKRRDWKDSEKDNRWYGTSPGDLYHIGFVTGVNPLEITHCTTPCAKTDDKIGSWAYWGKLEKASYNVADIPDPISLQKTLYVHADNGKPVNMRIRPSYKADIVARVPVGEAVTITNEENGWKYIKWQKNTGWMLDCFLCEDMPVVHSDPAPDVQTGSTATVCSENGKPVKMRSQPTTSSNLYDWLQIDTEVEVVAYDCVTDSKGNRWTRVNYSTRKGWYIMTKFLSFG